MSKRRHKRDFWKGARSLGPFPHSVLKPDTTRIMEAWNEFHNGRAIWRYSHGIWVTHEFSDCLLFLRNLDPASAKLELVRRGFHWIWSGSPISDGDTAGATVLQKSVGRREEPIRKDNQGALAGTLGDGGHGGNVMAFTGANPATLALQR